MLATAAHGRLGSDVNVKLRKLTQNPLHGITFPRTGGSVSWWSGYRAHKPSKSQSSVVARPYAPY
ncbi:hypothetical protein [Mycolicibacterium mengxianglii]|uniref:hypothetical protein n=1 Tax=Mycolicibacterium mengxianglii TaxID=2736649 RepID=UPI0018CFFE20|nr:hypothetical protein [Mycolicibacterium mengxianglii]